MGNFLELSVYFETFASVRVQEEPEFTFSGLLSAIGGAVSLYLGLSLVTMCEVVEMLCVVVAKLYRRNK